MLPKENRISKDLNYEDLERIIVDLRSELAGYKEIGTRAKAIFTQFKDVAERLQCGIYRFDMNSRRFLFFNRFAIQLLGSKESIAAEVSSKSILMRIHPDDLEMIRKAVTKSLSESQTKGEAEYRFRRKDGTYRWHNDRWVILRDASGQPKYIEGIVIDITQRKLTDDALKESERKLRELSTHLMEAQEKKFRKLAVELHDELAQTLTVLKLQLRSIKKALPATQWQTLNDCEDANTYVDSIIENVRRLSQDLYPSCLEDLGLDKSIAVLADDFAKHSQLKMAVNSPKIDAMFSLESKTHIYRVIQEAFTNIQKHAQARNVSIVIKNSKTHVDLKITDDGRGFVHRNQSVLSPAKTGLGLTAMKERTRMLGGAMKVNSTIGVGTELTFEIPKKENDKKDELFSYSFG